MFNACDHGVTFPIVASDYDQSCDQDTDCIQIGERNGCDCNVLCANAAINVKDEAKWRKDLSKTPASVTTCFCPLAGFPFCVHHRCITDPHPLEPDGFEMDGGS